jgi:hypothetical protein
MMPTEPAQSLVYICMNAFLMRPCADRATDRSDVKSALDGEVFVLRHLAYLRPELERMATVVEHPEQ